MLTYDIYIIGETRRCLHNAVSIESHKYSISPIRYLDSNNKIKRKQHIEKKKNKNWSNRINIKNIKN